jgi:hypothetical protein
MGHCWQDGRLSVSVSFRPIGRKELGAKFLCPITTLKQHLSAILYVNNTDILYIDLTNDESTDKVHTAIQGSVNSWENLLIATGGALQPNKCFYSIISFKWNNGEWRYAKNSTRDDLRITVPLPNGSSKLISHKKVSQAEKTLGAMTSPDGDSTASIALMQEKVQHWINAVCNGHLHQQKVWFSLKVQFWPRVGYGLCSSTATLDKLENVLHWQYYQISPLGGVVRTITVASRTIDVGFFGMGLPNLGIEALVATTNKLLMHYGCNTATKKLLQMSYSLFFVEAGLSFQPLQESYAQYGSLVTHSWVKMLWEKLSALDVKIVVSDHTLKFSCENYKFIMQALINKGYTGDTLRTLNRVRVSQQVLFMSDILTASGCKIDKEAELQRHDGE